MTGCILDREFVPTLVIDPVPFHDEEIRDRRADMRRGHRPERAADVVRGERNVIDLGHIGDLAALREAAALGDIGHDVIDRLLLEQIAKAPAQVEIFARAERNG